MGMSSYSIQTLTEKLDRLSLSQDSIETLSLWMIHHKSKAKTSVSTWLEEFKKGDTERRLILLYLTNDVLQNCRRRGADEFLTLFQDALRAAIPLVRGQKIQGNVHRMLKIWKERRVYDSVFLGELELVVEPTKPQTQEGKPAEFKLSLLEDALTELRKFEAELKVKSSHLAHLRVDISHPLASLEQLKDKADGGRVSTEIDDASQKLQDLCECLGVEVNERINVLDMLKHTKAFSAHKFNEFKRTVQNYKDLGTRVNAFKDKLQQHVRDVGRAQSTATSDPTADADITEAGDMEIESESDAEDLIEPPPVPPVSSIMTVGQASSQGVMGQSISSTPTQPHMMSSMSTQPLMAVSAVSTPQQPYTAPQNPNFYPNVAPTFSGPRIPTAANYPPRYRPPPMQRPPTMPPSRPPPFRHSVRLPPSTVPPPSTRVGVSIPPPSQLLEHAPPILPPHKPDAKPMAAPYPMAMSAMSLPSVKSSPPVAAGDSVSYKKEEGDEQNNETDTKNSIDARLENLQMSTKLFGMSTINDNGSNSDDKAFGDNELFTNFSENRNERYSPEEELNMDNPILQALYSSPQPAKALYSSPQPAASAHNSSLNNTGQSQSTIMEAGSKPPTSVDASHIKITPALTTLLDQLLPSLSKSLQMDRKRENNSSPEVPSNKIPRMNSDQPGPGPGAVHTKPAHDVPPWIRDQQFQPQQRHFDQQQQHYDQQQQQQYDDFSPPRFRPRYPSPRQRFRGPRFEMRMPLARPRGPPRFRARPPPPDDYRDGYRRPQQTRGRYGPEFDRRSTYS